MELAIGKEFASTVSVVIRGLLFVEQFGDVEIRDFGDDREKETS